MTRKSIIGVVVLLAALLGAAAAYYFYKTSRHQAESEEPPTISNAAPATEALPPEKRFPLPAQNSDAGTDASTRALPSLAESDSALRDVLAELFGHKPFETLFYPKNIIERMVISIDNLGREKLSAAMLPVKTMPPRFVANESEQGPILGPENYTRYNTVVGVLESVDSHRLTDTYIHFYPLFEQAYHELGYPSGYFNDRLVEVIDNLLATPELHEAPRLVQPHLMYQFADPDLESRSPGQKLLLRMGDRNAARVKKKLWEIRAQITQMAPQGK